MKKGLRLTFSAALFLLGQQMSFSYNACNGTQNPIDFVRLMTSDTTEFGPQGQRVYAFEDSEILGAYQIDSMVWQSSMTYAGTGGVNQFSPPPTASPRRAAAVLLDALSANQARMQIISGILDVKLNTAASKEMRAQAAYLREVEDESGAFVIFEQVQYGDYPSFQQRYWNTIARQGGLG